MVELRTRKREMRGEGTNHHEKLGLKKISRASQFPIPNMAGTYSNPLCIHTDPGSSQPNQASCIPDLSYPVISSRLFASSFPMSLFLVPNSTIIAEHKVTSSLSISPCHNHELTPSTSIHGLHHTPSTASTLDCLSSLHSHDYQLTPDCQFNFRRASLHDWPPLVSYPWELKGQVRLSHSHGCELTNWWIVSQHAAWSINRLPVLVESRSIAASECISKPTWSRPPSVSPDLLDYGLQVHLQTHSITASKCISRLARLRHSSLHDHSIHVHLKTHSFMAWKFAPLWPPSASPISLDHGHQVYPQTYLITACKCISKHSRSRPPSVSPDSLDYCIQVCTIIASMCISKLTRWWLASSHDHGLQVHLHTRLITASKFAWS